MNAPPATPRPSVPTRLARPLLTLLLAGCGSPLEAEDFSGALLQGALVTPAAQLSLVVGVVDPERDRVFIHNRSARPLEVTLGVYARSGDAVSSAAIEAFSGVWVELPLRQARDFVYLTVDGVPTQLIEYGEASPDLPLRGYLWASDPLPSPENGEVIVPAWPVFAQVPRGAYAYTTRRRDAERTLRGSVEDTEGRAIDAARVALSCAADDAWTTEGVGVEADGAFTLPLPEGPGACWVRVTAPDHLSLVLPVLIPTGGALERLILMPRSEEPGVRVSDTRIEFPNGAFLDAAAADLDAAGPLYLTVVPTLLSSMWTLAPDQLQGPAVDVHGVDETEHVRFPTDAAHLVLPLRGAESEWMEDWVSSAIPLGAWDSEAAPATVVGGDVVGNLLVHADALEFVVGQFSGAQVLPNADGTRRVVLDSIQPEEGRPIPSSDCLCLTQFPEPDGAVCNFGEGQSWSVEQEGSFSMEQGSETSLEGTLSRESGGGDTAPKLSLGASLARTWSSSSTQSLGFTFGLSGDCKIDQPRAPRLCETTHASRTLSFGSMSFHVEELDEWHWVPVDGLTNEYSYLNGKWVSGPSSDSEVLELSEWVLAGLLDLLPSRRYQPIWLTVAQGKFTYPLGCSPKAVFTYTPDYNACDCADLSADNSEKSGYAVHDSTQWADYRESLRCSGEGILRSRGERIVPGVQVQGGDPVSNPEIGARLSILCTMQLSALMDTRDEESVLCQAGCRRLDRRCSGVLLPSPTPRVIATVTPLTDARGAVSGSDWRLQCAAEAICQCTADVEEGGDPQGDPDGDGYPNNEDSNDFNPDVH